MLNAEPLTCVFFFFGFAKPTVSLGLWVFAPGSLQFISFPLLLARPTSACGPGSGLLLLPQGVQKKQEQASP